VVTTTGHDHPVVLRGASWEAPLAGPRLVERTEAGFVEALLADLRAADAGARLAAVAPRTRDTNGVRLFPPVQRTFTLVVLEVVCAPFAIPGLQPRLDPRRIESSGMVVRRLPAPGATGASEAGWRTNEAGLTGWVPFANEAAARQDPDPTRRRPVNGGPSGVALTEKVEPLFVVPPAVQAAAGKTLLFGVVPTASNEVATVPRDPAYDAATVRTYLPTPLLMHNGTIPFEGVVGRTVRATNAGEPALANLLKLLQALHIEFGAFRDTPAGQGLLAALNGVSAPFPGGNRPLGDVLRTAAVALVELDPSVAAPLPTSWPQISAGQEAAIVAAATAALNARAAEIEPAEGRFERAFERPEPRYVVRTFVRLRRDDGCPPDLVWSEASEPFTIAPWYESNPGVNLPPARIELPNPFDREALQRLKPNATFQVPGNLFNFLQQDPKKMLDGDFSPGPQSAIVWICSFSIPIITLCAFIVLSIFLALLNLFFQWIFFVKICIPLPRRS
jgi:hypothetical protein